MSAEKVKWEAKFDRWKPYRAPTVGYPDVEFRASYDDGPARTPQERLGMLWGEGGTGTDEELAAYAVLSDLLGGGGTQETEGVDG